MFVDASALVAIVAREPDAETLESRLKGARRRFTSPLALYEAALGLARLGRVSVEASQNLLERFVDDIEMQIVPITHDIGRLALEAFSRFGRGRHSAQLNMGDCFAYACARSLGVPLLFKGDDFSRTDIAVA